LFNLDVVRLCRPYVIVRVIKTSEIFMANLNITHYESFDMTRIIGCFVDTLFHMINSWHPHTRHVVRSILSAGNYSLTHNSILLITSFLTLDMLYAWNCSRVVACWHIIPWSPKWNPCPAFLYKIVHTHQ